jgi:probable HAF family extracellular repeat protein
MKSRILTLIAAMTLFAALALPVSLAGQDKAKRHHHHKYHHYQLIDLGPLGGPQSYNESDPLENIINIRGAAAGYADTSVPDPFFPNCFNSDCFVSHAFIWRRGHLTDLGSLLSGYSSFASSINARGEIVGASQNGQIDPLTAYPADDAVLWKNGIINNLGTLGGNQSVANAINDRGQVAGAALNAIPDPLSNAFSQLFLFVPAATQAHAFRWTEAEGMQDLGTLGGPDSTAAFVNQCGQIAGQSYTNATVNPTTGFATLDPFFWENGKMVDIGTLGGTFGYPFWMNNRGQVVGSSNTAGDVTAHPFLWPGKDGKIRDLGTLGGTFGHSDWINDAGEVVGTATTAGDQFRRAFLWRHGVMTDLGTVGTDHDSEASSINLQGQVVGTSGADLHGFLWEHGGPIVDLETLVLPGSGVTVTQAIDINDRGEIAARGVLFSNPLIQRALLLIPCDENHAGVEGCDYSMVDAATAAQNSAPRYVPSATQRLPQSRRTNRYHLPGIMASPRD